jgi:single-strand DNA-binding protein
MELTGKLKVIFEEKVFASGFNKKEFVITTEEQYPSDIIFEASKDKIALLGNLRVGDKVKVHFDISGREWQGRYYNNLRMWRIESVAAAAAEQLPPLPPDLADYGSDKEDDLPF